MTRKRVSINISLPNHAFKAAVLRHAEERGVSPSEEFQALYKRIIMRSIRKR